MEVIAVIMAALASMRRLIVTPFLTWRVVKKASEKGHYVEIDAESNGAVHIKYDGRPINSPVQIVEIDAYTGEERERDVRRSLSARETLELAAPRRQGKRSRAAAKRRHNKKRRRN